MNESLDCQREKKDTGIDLRTKVRLSPHKKRRNRSTYEGKIRLSKRKKEDTWNSLQMKN